jgi:SAM-dependent methyltransferase
MKLRESGMPEECYWETLFDVDLILDRLKIDNRLQDVVELGCGYGTFSLPVGRRISGSLRTFDIDADMVKRTAQRATAEGIDNVICEQRDVFTDGFGLSQNSQDGCLLFNILHGEEPLGLLKEAACVVRSGGCIYAIHWRYDPATPRGPSMNIRPRPDQIVEWGLKAGLRVAPSPVIDLPPWHYGIRFSVVDRFLERDSVTAL